MVAWCGWASAGCLVVAVAATTVGIDRSARPLKPTEHEGLYSFNDMSGAVWLGVGLPLTTLAGLFALLAAPPWLE